MKCIQDIYMVDRKECFKISRSAQLMLENDDHGVSGWSGLCVCVCASHCEWEIDWSSKYGGEERYCIASDAQRDTKCYDGTHA